MDQRNIAVTLECFVRKDGKYLMLYRSPDKRIMPNVWMAPGGHREFNEGLFECARREIKEETGLEIKNLHIKATGNAYLKNLNEEFYFHFVFADYASGTLMQNDKEGELIWLTPKEILKLDKLLAELKHVLPQLFSGKQQVISFKAEYENENKLTYIKIEES